MGSEFAAACILDVQDLISIRCRARFNAAGFICRYHCSQRNKRDLLDGSVYFVSAYRSSCICCLHFGVHSLESKPICKQTNLAFAVNEAEYLDISRKGLRLAQAKAILSKIKE